MIVRLLNGIATAIATTATGTIAATSHHLHEKVKVLAYFH